MHCKSRCADITERWFRGGKAIISTNLSSIYYFFILFFKVLSLLPALLPNILNIAGRVISQEVPFNVSHGPEALEDGMLHLPAGVDALNKEGLEPASSLL